jgi:hypothetical protein
MATVIPGRREWRDNDSTRSWRPVTRWLSVKQVRAQWILGDESFCCGSGRGEMVVRKGMRC